MDVERTIAFLREQQARLVEADSKHDSRLAKIEQDTIQLNSIVLSFATAQQTTNAIVEALAERLVELTEQVAALTTRQDQTEQMLQSLLRVVERHIANHP